MPTHQASVHPLPAIDEHDWPVGIVTSTQASRVNPVVGLSATLLGTRMYPLVGPFSVSQTLNGCALAAPATSANASVSSSGSARTRCVRDGSFGMHASLCLSRGSAGRGDARSSRAL